MAKELVSVDYTIVLSVTPKFYEFLNELTDKEQERLKTCLRAGIKLAKDNIIAERETKEQANDVEG